MNKYLSIFKISFQQEFVYRLNFIMWRVRNVLQIFLIFFLWDSVFTDPGRVVFGYDRAKILTYVFGLMIVRALVLSSRTLDIAGEIARGELTNYLLKPVNFFKYWFTRDLSSKALNLIFAAIEFIILYLIFRPDLFFQGNIGILLLSLVSLALAILVYFVLLFFLSLFPFWYPQQAWGLVFLLFVFTDFLGGGIFPLDILSGTWQKVLYLTPFPYLLFVPLQIYLGKVSVIASLQSIFIAGVWIVVLSALLKYLWNLGLKSYRAEGR